MRVLHGWVKLTQTFRKKVQRTRRKLDEKGKGKLQSLLNEKVRLKVGKLVESRKILHTERTAPAPTYEIIGTPKYIRYPLNLGILPGTP